MTNLSRHYPFASPDYILKKMTWGQVWIYYDAYLANKADKEYEGEEVNAPVEPIRLQPGMAGVKRRADGALEYGK
jgi:hypothetical protein